MIKSIENTFQDQQKFNHKLLILYVFGFKHKITFCLRPVPDTADYLLPIEDILRSRFIPAITGGHICSDAKSELLALPVKFGGLK